MMTQAQAVVIKDIIDTVDIIEQKIDNIDKGLEDANLYWWQETICARAV